MKRSIAKTLSVVLAVMLTFAVFTALPLSANAETVLNLTATSNFFTDCTTAAGQESLLNFCRTYFATPKPVKVVEVKDFRNPDYISRKSVCEI